jgi:lysophospholipid acyltransferase (LPLAT)-like uncharacterized protein
MADTHLVRDTMRRVVRRARDSTWPFVAAGKAGAGFMRFVRATSAMTVEPGNPFDIYADRQPFILSTWHGQHLMLGLLMRPENPTSALISKSRDGELQTAFFGSFGIKPIRGSGGRDRLRAIEKGGARGFLQLRRALDDGESVAIVADIPNTVRRRCGPGIVTLARASGRPIIPLGFATSHWYGLNTWDKATIHLPFSRAAMVIGPPVEVPGDADDSLLEAKRKEVERDINAAMDRAYELVGRNREW